MFFFFSRLRARIFVRGSGVHNAEKPKVPRTLVLGNSVFVAGRRDLSGGRQASHGTPTLGGDNDGDSTTTVAGHAAGRKRSIPPWWVISRRSAIHLVAWRCEVSPANDRFIRFPFLFGCMGGVSFPKVACSKSLKGRE